MRRQSALDWGQWMSEINLDKRIRYPARGYLGKPVLEAGCETDLASMKKVAVVAQWSRSGVATRSLRELVRQLSHAGYGCVIVSTSDSSKPLVWPNGMPDGSVLYRRANIGHDFGSWAAMLHYHPEIAASERVILVNDSLVGPFSCLKPLILANEESRHKVWSLTESEEGGIHHLQSFFLGFSDGVLGRDPLYSFFEGVRAERSKSGVVARYEIGLSEVVRSSTVTMGSHFQNRTLGVAAGSNPTHGRDSNWLKLMEAGFPFLKRSFVTSRSKDAMHSLVSKVDELYGVGLSEWLRDDGLCLPK